MEIQGKGLTAGKKTPKNSLLKSSRETIPLGTDSVRGIPETPAILIKLSVA